ncbi:MAG: EscU/YscU/HrcU family type III secretion system export apparatus switch protein [bacterium]|nr:EscU/YscU/HrcU family type III secretion system export apparatus switch protein [bacterium]
MSDAEKKHPASARQREKAIRDGDSPRSQLLAAALILLAGGLLVCTLGETVYFTLCESARETWRQAFEFEKTDLRVAMSHAVGLVALIAVAFAMLIAAVAAMVQFGQFGGRWFFKTIEMKWERISPSTGAARVFSLDTLSGVVFDVAKGVVLFATLGGMLWRNAEPLASIGLHPTDRVLSHALALLWQTAAVSLVGLAVVGIAEFAWNRFRWEERLKMTDQQLREELREQAPNPVIVREQRRRRQGATASSAATPVSSVDAQSPI